MWVRNFGSREEYRQATKFNSPPNFSAIWYSAMHEMININTPLKIAHIFQEACLIDHDWLAHAYYNATLLYPVSSLRALLDNGTSCTIWPKILKVENFRGFCGSCIDHENFIPQIFIQVRTCRRGQPSAHMLAINRWMFVTFIADGDVSPELFQVSWSTLGPSTSNWPAFQSNATAIASANKLVRAIQTFRYAIEIQTRFVSKVHHRRQVLIGQEAPVDGIASATSPLGSLASNHRLELELHCMYCTCANNWLGVVCAQLDRENFIREYLFPRRIGQNHGIFNPRKF